MKKKVHVKEYTRKRHGRAKFGGKVRSHDKSGRMLKKGKLACDWCGKTFRKDTPRTVYGKGYGEGGRAYHEKCLKEMMEHTPVYDEEEKDIVWYPTEEVNKMKTGRATTPFRRREARAKIMKGKGTYHKMMEDEALARLSSGVPAMEIERMARDEYHMTGSKATAFARFIKIRFPNEGDKEYIAEWIRRVKTGHPERYADKKTLEVLRATGLSGE